MKPGTSDIGDKSQPLLPNEHGASDSPEAQLKTKGDADPKASAQGDAQSLTLSYSGGR